MSTESESQGLSKVHPFLVNVGTWCDDAGINRTTLDKYQSDASHELRRNEQITEKRAAKLILAIWRFYQDFKNTGYQPEQEQNFWSKLGRGLTGATPLAANLDFDTFQSLFLDRLGFHTGDDTGLLRHFWPYLGSEADACWQLVTRGINLANGTKPLRLARVYVNLDTKTPRPQTGEKKGITPEGEPVRSLSALEILFDPSASRVVLVGEPGSGKSTFVQFSLLSLTFPYSQQPDARIHFADLQDKTPGLLKQKQGQIIPLRIMLKEFAASLTSETGSSEQIISFLSRQMQNIGFKTAAEKLPELLAKSGLALVLLDGLDEVPRPKVKAVREAIEAFSKGAYAPCRMVVTCRTQSYKKSEFQLSGFSGHHEIASLSPKLQTLFVNSWYEELEQAQPQFKKGEGAACAFTLISALADDRLREMAGNPFFLTAMAALHAPDKELPNTGAELMNELVRCVLEETRKRQAVAKSGDGQSELADLLSNVHDGFNVLRWRLEAVAYQTREKRQNRGSRFVDEDTLKQKLRLAKTVDDDWVGTLLDILRHRAGLLQSQDGFHFEFAYRFEEFLAGCYLANNNIWPAEKPFHTRAIDLLKQQGDYARQVVIWAAGYLVYVTNSKGLVRDLAAALVPSQPMTSNDGFTLFGIQLAADIARDARMEEWQDEDVPYSTDTISRLRSRLDEIRENSEMFNIKDRTAAASAIGRLGDTRKGVGVTGNGLPDIDFTTEVLPAGKFKLAESGKQIEIKQPYNISLYPVTVVQYQAFVKAGGYEDDGSEEAAQKLLKWWTPDGLNWKRETKITGPEDYDPVFRTPNHPRVGVSWYEATAFCAWLSNALKITIRLPNEADWEQAARWNARKKKADNRYFPWGGGKDSPDLAERCNMAKTGLNHTSAVGLFPSGKAECGAMDMSGNVWEWCENRYDDKWKDARVLRGGSWVNGNPEDLSCSCRVSGPPGGRLISVGFRVVRAGASAR